MFIIVETNLHEEFDSIDKATEAAATKFPGKSVLIFKKVGTIDTKVTLKKVRQRRSSKVGKEKNTVSSSTEDIPLGAVCAFGDNRPAVKRVGNDFLCVDHASNDV